MAHVTWPRHLLPYVYASEAIPAAFVHARVPIVITAACSSILTGHMHALEYSTGIYAIPLSPANLTN